MSLALVSTIPEIFLAAVVNQRDFLLAQEAQNLFSNIFELFWLRKKLSCFLNFTLRLILIS
jgi:hypothetical protein